ncbi:MAG: hypothetical protein ACJ8IQ_03505 [Chthoniobacterales bacterium]
MHDSRPLWRWFAELLLVFVGAYAAFWLNNYQEHRTDVRRHDEILALLEQQVARDIEAGKNASARQAEMVAKFQRAYDAGEMPPLDSWEFNSDYSATDIATLLQSGGYQLLDPKTLFALRNAESTIRSGINTMTHFQKLSDELILPNLDKDITFFYDPAMRKLRRPFAAYPKALESVKKFLDDYVIVETDLLKQLQAERQH